MGLRIGLRLGQLAMWLRRSSPPDLSETGVLAPDDSLY